jgi:hypothetical protein
MTPPSKYDTADQGNKKFGLWVLLKEISIKIKMIRRQILLRCIYNFRTKNIINIRIIFVISSVIDTANHKYCDFIVEYLGEFDSILNKALTCRSGAHRELFDSEKPEIKNLVKGYV